MSDVKDYLATLRANNPSLAGHWLGEKPGQTVNKEPEPEPVAPEPVKEEPVATSIKRGCLPCATGHLTTCVGVLNEAMRFARTDGIGSDQVLDDANTCISELNAMERVDLRPERIAQLPEWEKVLVLKVLALSKETRLGLEAMRTPEDLEKIAANLQPKQREIIKQWYRYKMNYMSPEDKARLVDEAIGELAKEQPTTS